eukprot:TRINITY_DN527_c0_g2_i9.p1 TRINITY_DN527_c0_g2~~TRINITY_DN527_c0_g2_i9.p1  ORF type:complete len:214 (-),score=80.28 TRINITY_DN527_c0_g2_i9:144-785(-)
MGKTMEASRYGTGSNPEEDEELHFNGDPALTKSSFASTKASGIFSSLKSSIARMFAKKKVETVGYKLDLEERNGTGPESEAEKMYGIGTVVDKEKVPRMFKCSKESQFDLLKLIHKVRYIGLKDHWLYIIKEQNSKKYIKQVYELKRLFKVAIKRVKENVSEVVLTFFNKEYDPMKLPIVKKYLLRFDDANEFIDELLNLMNESGYKKPTIEE